MLWTRARSQHTWGAYDKDALDTSTNKEARIPSPDSLLPSLSQASIQCLAGYAQMHGSDGLVAVGALHGLRNQQLFSLFKGG